MTYLDASVGRVVDSLNRSGLLESTFNAYSLLNDIPGADACAPDEGWPRLIAVWLHMVGVLTFAVVLAIVSDGIGTKVESLRTTLEPLSPIRDATRNLGVSADCPLAGPWRLAWAGRAARAWSRCCPCPTSHGRARGHCSCLRA